MVQAACQYYLEHTTTQPIPMDIVFNMSDNVRHIRLFHTNGTTAFQVFCGNPQYIPPEIFLGATYKHGLADVWVLGISLYRMLVGKYPFIASTDRGLFKKMLKGDFSIPNHFSDDVKDLLRRMLAPDTARASLDLVMFHQWLKPYSVGVPATAHSSALVEPPTETAKANAKAKAKAKRQESAGTEPEMETKTEKLKKKSLMTGGTSTETAKPSKPAKPAYKKRHILRRLLVLIFQGPCPPPKQPYREFAHFGRTNPPA
ncbi:kinase-like domain-containing protein [Spinellus fusiger]|nr:kinase-like domain-containing protein [Spinellus fusiger]